MRHIILLVFFAVLFPYRTLAQSSVSRRPQFWLGVSFEPNIAYRQLKYSSPNEWVANERNEEELPTIGFTTGINVRWRWSNKFSIGASLIYADRGITTKATELVWEMPQANYPVKSKTVYSFEYIEAPVALHYHFHITNLKVYAMGGFSLNYFLSRTTSIITYHANGRTNKEKDNLDFGYSPITSSVIIGFGLDIYFRNRWLLNVEPIYRQNITSISCDKNGKEYLFSGGLNVKLFYHLKRKRNK